MRPFVFVFLLAISLAAAFAGVSAAESFEDGDVTSLHDGEAEGDVSVQWSRAVGDEGDDRFRDVVATGEGGFVAVAEKGYDAVEDGGSTDVRLVKFDVHGEIEWSRSYDYGDDHATSVDLGHDGGYVVSGHTRHPNGSEGQTGWLMQVDSGGEVVDRVEYDTVRERADFGCWVTRTEDGGYALAHYNQSRANMVKYDGDLEVEWSTSVGGEETDALEYVTETSDGGLVFAGYTGLRAETDAWLTKTGPDGELDWQATVDAGETDRAWWVRESADGYVVGGSTGDHGESNPLLFELNRSGEVRWTREYDSDWTMTRTAVSEEQGYTFVASHGPFESTGAGAGLVSVDGDGEVRWTASFDVPNSTGAWGVAATDKEDAYVLAGETGAGDDSEGWIAVAGDGDVEPAGDFDVGTVGGDGVSDVDQDGSAGDDDTAAREGRTTEVDTSAEDTHGESLPGFGVPIAVMAVLLTSFVRLHRGPSS